MTVIAVTSSDEDRELRRYADGEDVLKAIGPVVPDDETTRAAFRRLSVSHNGTRRYLLRKFEEHLRSSDELAVNQPSRVHVEHIYPQSPQEGERLSNHSQIVDRMGNLTLLGRRLNTTIKNSPFPVKKPYYEESELFLTKELVSFSSWDVAAIEERQAYLSELVQDIWPAPELPE